MVGAMEKTTGRLRARIQPIDTLRPEQRTSLWEMFQRYYVGVEPETFEADLRDKDELILLSDSRGTIAGFSTLKTYRKTVEGRPIIVVFSGDTIVEPAYWGQTCLQRAFFRYVMKVKFKAGRTPVYWYLLSKGYKTYLLLSRNFATYYPRHDLPTPTFERALIQTLSVERYGEAFEPQRGVLQAEACPGRLRSGVAPLDLSLLSADDIRFFHQRNPGHAAGDELCCLGLIDHHLARKFCARVVRKSLRASARRAKALWTWG